MTQNIEREFSACGVGFTASRNAEASHQIVRDTLHALTCEEHRGACAVDTLSSDGSGVMFDIPFEMLGYAPGSVALASIFAPQDPLLADKAFTAFEKTFQFFGLEIVGYRDVPIETSVLGPIAKQSLPRIRQAFIAKPPFVHSDDAFNTLLYKARQMTRTKEREAGVYKQFFFSSLSSTTIVYKALTRAEDLANFYPDLKNPLFTSRFGVFHRRFSTNTRTSWDKAQPFRLIAHNGEINTISGNRAWAYSREQALGLPVDELLTHKQVSDSGNLNEMAEALKYRSSIPYLGDVLSIMIPPARFPNEVHKLWSRAMEPWDGPAFVVYCEEETVGARLDRNGFRPCRWAMSEDRFYLASEAGSFDIPEASIIRRGNLDSGSGVSVSLTNGRVDLFDAALAGARKGVSVDSRLICLAAKEEVHIDSVAERQILFGYSKEDLDLMILPMAALGKEPIGSMGNTARLAVLSDQARPLFDYFYQHFAQVTNPPVDYIRERIVTDLSMYVGRMPNIFSPKELIPPFVGIELSSPILSIAQMTELQTLLHVRPFRSILSAKMISAVFNRSEGSKGFADRLEEIGKEAQSAAVEGYTVLIISDQEATYERPAIPSLLALGSVNRALDRKGLRLKTSIVVFSAEVRSAHHLSCLIGFGACAVCPYLAIASVRESDDKLLSVLDSQQREKNFLLAMETGLLRVMSKVGISVARSYQSSRLFSCFGIAQDILDRYFPEIKSPIGGLSLESLCTRVLLNARDPEKVKTLHNTYQFKEQSKGREGERHSMTVLQSRSLHKLVRETEGELAQDEAYRQYIEVTESYYPISIRHLWKLEKGSALSMEQVEPIEEIFKRFGSGAMSFGAISAESQRDIFLAMNEIGARSNSGEGGENPYYWTNGITASTKQVASGRFGVTGQYLISANEIQIKIAQGAKPGEGGQLMKEKVSEDIARARHSKPGIDLISPPPMHDIYSIEDLKELIYELKQFNPSAKVNVKLVSGADIGTIAVGVAKAGADSIHISGGDGGTGAAALTSMKHAGLPWEIGLSEVHRTLIAHSLRQSVELRTDGGLSTGRDIVIAAILGAEGFDFGKLLLVAEGCIMARLCQKNTCPVGIATHSERFKKKYRGEKDHIITLLRWIAQDVREQLAYMGVASLAEVRGRSDLLAIDKKYAAQVISVGLQFESFFESALTGQTKHSTMCIEGVSALNRRIADDIFGNPDVGEHHYSIRSTDRAIPATLCGEIAKRKHQHHMRKLSGEESEALLALTSKIYFTGSAGQGFGMLLEDGLEVHLSGEANDSVAKSINGGVLAIRPSQNAPKDERIVLIGNCALYGATGGELYVRGAAGGRFGVRNSGATAVVEGLGLHGCEYMTSGQVLVLGFLGGNFGAGMTGGKAYLLDADSSLINTEYLHERSFNQEDHHAIHALLTSHITFTESPLASLLISNWSTSMKRFSKWVPVSETE